MFKKTLKQSLASLKHTKDFTLNKLDFIFDLGFYLFQFIDDTQSYFEISL